MGEVALSMWKDEAWVTAFVEQPEVWGVEDLRTEGVLIRLTAKTKPLMSCHRADHPDLRVPAGHSS